MAFCTIYAVLTINNTFLSNQILCDLETSEILQEAKES